MSEGKEALVALVVVVVGMVLIFWILSEVMTIEDQGATLHEYGHGTTHIREFIPRSDPDKICVSITDSFGGSLECFKR